MLWPNTAYVNLNEVLQAEVVSLTEVIKITSSFAEVFNA